MFLRCNWIGTNNLFFKEGPLHQIEVGVSHSFQDTGVCRAFWYDERTFTEEGYQSVDQQWSDKRASWSSDYDPFSHLWDPLLQNRIASKLVLSQQVLMLLNKIITPRRCHVLYVFPDPFMSFPSTCQMLFHISESIRPSSNRESNLVKSLGMGPATKSDEFSAINIWPSYLLAYICNHICHKKNCNIIFRNEGGGGKAFWNFSENSSHLVAGPFPYLITQADFGHN